MSSRSDAVTVAEGMSGPVGSNWPRLPVGLKCLVSAIALAALAACGGGGGDPNQLVVNTTVTGLAPLSSSGLYGGGARLDVRRTDNTLLQPVSIDSNAISPAGVYALTVNAPAGTALQLVLTQHPRNQLCAVTTPALVVGQAQGEARLACLPAILNDTGVTTCATESDRPELCAFQDHLAGRDAERERLNRVTSDATLKSAAGFDYTRLCNSGLVDGSGGCQLGASPATGDSLSQWGCTRDNATGLVWLVREAPIATYLADNIPGSAPSNLVGACGLSQWFLPTAAELASLIHSGKLASEPAVSADYFPNLTDSAKSRFWTSTQVRSANNVFVDFSANGRVVTGAAPNEALHVVWVSREQLVQPPGYADASRFSASASGAIISDRLTGLAWSVCSLGRGEGTNASAPCTGEAIGYSWRAALNAVRTANLNKLAGYDDWRLPSRAELASLLDFSVQSGVLLNGASVMQALRDDAVDSGAQGTSYWTSTAVPGPSSPTCGARVRPFQVNFGDGSVSALFPEDCPGDEFAVRLRVRLVRDAR